MAPKEWVRRYAPQATDLLEGHRREETTVVEIPLPEANYRGGRLAYELADCTAWVEAKPGRMGVLDVGPPGASKTEKMIKRLVASGHGSLLPPRHNLTDEQMERYRKAGGGESVRFDGIMRQLGILRPDLARRLRPFAELGFPPDAFLKRKERPRAVSGEGNVSHGVHAHLRVVPVGRAGADGRQMLGTPVFMDEAPTLLDRLKFEMSNLERLTAESAHPELNEWLQGRRPIAKTLVRTARLLMERRKVLPHHQTRYPERFHGMELGNVVVEAAGGVAQLREALQASAPTRKAELQLGSGTVQALSEPPNVGGWQATEIMACFAGPHATAASTFGPAPYPPVQLVRDGTLSANDWPHRDSDTLLAALFAEVEAADLQGPPGCTACLVVSGRGEGVKVHAELRRRWSAQVPRHISLVVADATASYTEEALRAAWPGWEVRFFRLRVLPAEPEATTRVWFMASQSAYKRRRLLQKAHPKTGAILRPRAVQALVRLLQAAVVEMLDAFGPGKSMATILPKPLRPILEAADRVARGDDDAKDLELLTKNEAGPIAESLAAMRQAGMLGSFAIEHQVAVAGTNRLEGCDALLTFPFVPDIGAVTEDARALGVDAKRLIAGLAAAELIQETHRLRPLRATSEAPKLLIHVGDVPPPDWTDHRCVRMPEGGPIPSVERGEAERVAAKLAAAHGAVSAALIRWIAGHGEVYARVPGALDDIEAIKRAAGLGRSSLVRSVRAATPEAWAAQVSHPEGRGGTWILREVRLHAAQKLIEAIQKAREEQ